MRKFNATLLIPIFILGVASSAMLHASGELYCTVSLEGQNRNRTVAGAIYVNAGAVLAPSSIVRLGGIGVVFELWRCKRHDQFRGWKWQDGRGRKNNGILALPPCQSTRHQTVATTTLITATRKPVLRQ